MPIIITNTTGSPLPLNDLGISPIPVSSSFSFDHTDGNRHKLMFSKNLKAAIKSGDATVAYDFTGAGDTFDADVVVFSNSPGNSHLVKKSRTPWVAKTSGAEVLVPDNPDDGDIIFSPLHRIEFYWDGTRSKWLSVAIFDLYFCKAGATAVDDYLSLSNVSPTLGANFPLTLCFVTSVVTTNVSGTAHQTDFALMKNGVEDLVIPIANGNFSELNLVLDHSVVPVAQTEEGYRIKIKAVEGGGTTPIDPLIILGYRLELINP